MAAGSMSAGARDDRRPIGVLMMAYGTPSGPDDVASFYTDVRRGSPPSPEQLADLVRRYDAIGGVSPLASRTADQVTGVQRALDSRDPGRYLCALGTKHSAPRLEQTVDRFAADGITELVGVVLAPHYSKASVGEYLERAAARADQHDMTSKFVEHWHDDPVLVGLLARNVESAVASLGRPGAAARAGGSLLLLVTAHSLPLRAVADGDPYVSQLGRTAELVAEAACLERVEIAWQSAGRTSDTWLGPDILEVISGLPARGIDAVVVCPAGFTSDHLEVLFDLDVDAARVAARAGVAFSRTASLNADPLLCAALADLVVARGKA